MAKGFMYADIQREVDLARDGKNGANLMTALALLCYTEFGGGLLRGNKFSRDDNRKNFYAFFNAMGKGYSDFGKENNVYSIFRNGLVHEYFAKKNCRIAMLKGKEELGIGRLDNGEYFFVVEQYFEDFKTVFDEL